VPDIPFILYSPLADKATEWDIVVQGGMPASTWRLFSFPKRAVCPSGPYSEDRSVMQRPVTRPWTQCRSHCADRQKSRHRARDASPEETVSTIGVGIASTGRTKDGIGSNALWLFAGSPNRIPGK
jgi:hypothetical protein